MQVGNVNGACNDVIPCALIRGNHMDITRSCNANDACYGQGDINSDMNDCCSEPGPCKYANNPNTSNPPLPNECTATKVRQNSNFYIFVWMNFGNPSRVGGFD